MRSMRLREYTSTQVPPQSWHSNTISISVMTPPLGGGTNVGLVHVAVFRLPQGERGHTSACAYALTLCGALIVVGVVMSNL